jgi:hypothetical protein
MSILLVTLLIESAPAKSIRSIGSIGSIRCRSVVDRWFGHRRVQWSAVQ